MNPRLCSKTTDKLAIVASLLKKLGKVERLKRMLVTWDRIQDPQEGTVIVPIIEVELYDAPLKKKEREPFPFCPV